MAGVSVAEGIAALCLSLYAPSRIYWSSTEREGELPFLVGVWGCLTE